MKNRLSVEAVVLALFLVLVAVLTAAGFLWKEWRPPVATVHGQGVDRMITYLLVTTGILFLVGHGVLVWFLLRPAGEGAGYKPVRPRTEWIWALVPVLAMSAISEAGVLVIGMPVWADIYGPVPEDAVTVEVVGKQFEWLVRYPGKTRSAKYGRVEAKFVHDTDNPLGLDEKDSDATDDIVLRGTLVLPVGRTAVIRLRSQDVIHSFSVPEFRVKQDVIPGYAASTKFVPNRTGTFEIACTELCGLGHYKMRGVVKVVAEEEFKSWLAEQTGWFE